MLASHWPRFSLRPAPLPTRRTMGPASQLGADVASPLRKGLASARAVIGARACVSKKTRKKCGGGSGCAKVARILAKSVRVAHTVSTVVVLGRPFLHAESFFDPRQRAFTGVENLTPTGLGCF
jgi:hypothetical protein